MLKCGIRLLFPIFPFIKSFFPYFIDIFYMKLSWIILNFDLLSFAFVLVFDNEMTFLGSEDDFFSGVLLDVLIE